MKATNMIKRIRFTPEAFQRYLDGLNEKFDTTILWNTLQGKSEYGSSKNEKAYQKVAATKAALMARRLGRNEERTSFYAKCLGAAFPAYGKEGEERIKEYACAYDLPYEEKETLASVVEESFAQSGKFVIEGLREILLDLFDDSKDSDVEEIELAKLYHEEMEILKALEQAVGEDYSEWEKELDEEIIKGISEFGITGAKRRLAERKRNLRVETSAMSSEEKEQYYKTIDLYRDYSGDECLINFILHARNPR